MSVGQVVSVLEKLTAEIDEQSWAAEDLEDDQLSYARAKQDQISKRAYDWCMKTMYEDRSESLDMRIYIGQPKNPKYSSHHYLPSVTESGPGKA
jgi:hypothetical protein